MDQELQRIYGGLLAAYDVKKSNILDQIKATLILNQEKSLRPDASLCLLTLYDNMIVTPYSLRLRTASSQVNGANVGIFPQNEQELNQRVMDSFYLLLQTIDRDKKDLLASSHDVIIAINSIWGPLSSYFNWG